MLPSPAPTMPQLRARRLRLHRLRPSRPLRSGHEATTFVCERGIVLVTARNGLPSLADAIAGRRLSGSWMANPECHRIYDLVGAVDGRAVLFLPLANGKECAVDRTLGPAIQRIASDAGRVRAARQALPADAARLLGAAERSGEVRMSRIGWPTARGRKARTALQETLLAWTESVHTDSGRHEAVVRPWSRSPLARFAPAARRLGYLESIERLLAAAVRAAVLVPEREARRWFRFCEDRTDSLVASGAIRRLRGPGGPWLAAP